MTMATRMVTTVEPASPADMKTPELMTPEELKEWIKGDWYRHARICRNCGGDIDSQIFIGEDYCCELCRKVLYEHTEAQPQREGALPG